MGTSICLASSVSNENSEGPPFMAPFSNDCWKKGNWGEDWKRVEFRIEGGSWKRDIMSEEAWTYENRFSMHNLVPSMSFGKLLQISNLCQHSGLFIHLSIMFSN